MIRKVIHLVRTVTLSDEIQAVVETSSSEKLDAIEPVVLWSFFSQQGLLPDTLEESDDGIDKYLGDYAPQKHIDLYVVDVVAEAVELTSSSSIGDQPRLPPQGQPDMIRMVVTLTRSIAQIQVMRAIAEGPNQDTIQEVDANDFWWKCVKLGVPVEKDQQWEPEFSIELEPYNADMHDHLPFVTLPDEIALDDRPEIRDDSSRWHPTVVSKEKDKLESRRVGDLVYVEPNQCYFNARRVMRSLPNYSEATYVEGFVVTEDGACIEHGWIVKDGNIIDPTLPKSDDSYFAGLEFAGREGIRRFLSTQLGIRYSNYPFHEAFGWNPGLNCPSFLKAFIQAMQHLSSNFGNKAVEAAFSVRVDVGLPWSDDWR